jgi:hypothetical protein
MLEDDAPYGSLVGKTHIVSVGLDYLEPLNIEPLLSLCVTLATMNVNRLAPFIGVEKEPPAKYHRNRRHLASVFSAPLILPLDGSRCPLDRYSISLTAFRFSMASLMSVVSRLHFLTCIS